MAAHTLKAREICAGSIYPIAELEQRLGLGKAALRKARREGLLVRRIGRRSFVFGDDVIDYFKRSARPI
jgi:hypothetical protein